MNNYINLKKKDSDFEKTAHDVVIIIKATNIKSKLKIVFII